LEDRFFGLDRMGVRRETMPTMQWSEPKFEEISLGCEINSYACAEL
jgi:coenzyme PQQ precursor peptide PqqA